MMSEEKFWKSTPRKINALLMVYLELESAKAGGKDEDKKGKQKMVYIDQIL